MTRRRKTAQAGWPLADYLEHQLAEVNGFIAKAGERNDFAGANALIKTKNALRKELDQLASLGQARSIPETALDYLEELLVEIREMRTQAKAGGSWVAATNLLKIERELVKDRDELMKSQDEEVELTLEEALDLVKKKVEALPPVTRAQLKARGFEL